SEAVSHNGLFYDCFVQNKLTYFYYYMLLILFFIVFITIKSVFIVIKEKTADKTKHIVIKLL
ncbi:hypothetical protein, partial [Yersinia pekkanenii]|uniref:hypothetical protein n=1 Tax=Yersinia pekkanenii TaxID=1288385 RepID=UPI00066FF2FE